MVRKKSRPHIVTEAGRREVVLQSDIVGELLQTLSTLNKLEVLQQKGRKLSLSP